MRYWHVLLRIIVHIFVMKNLEIQSMELGIDGRIVRCQ